MTLTVRELNRSPTLYGGSFLGYAIATYVNETTENSDWEEKVEYVLTHFQVSEAAQITISKVKTNK